MPDIQQQLDSLTRALPSVTEEFQGVARSLDNITGNAESTANAFQNLVLTTEGQLNATKDLEKELPKLAKEMSQLTKGSRITNKGFKALEDSLGQAGKDLSKSLQAVYGQTDKAIGKVNNAFEKFSSRIPVIGKTIQKGFENFMGSFEGVIDKYMARIQRAGAVGRGGMAAAGILGAAGVAAAVLLGRQFNQIEKSSIAISKATGLTGKDLEGVRTSMRVAQDASYQLGISMEESASASSALVTSLGDFRKITPELIKQTTVLAKFTGASAEEAGKFVGTLTKGFGKSAEDVDKFVDGIATFATREGVNARKVLGDIVSDTNLMSIYMSRGEDALKRAAVQAAKMGMSLSETQGVSEAFLDLEGGAELVGQINMYTGGSLNALEMFNLAAKNDTVGIMNRLNQAFSTPQGIRFIEDMPGLAKQFAGQFGMNLKQLRIAAGLDRERSKISDGELKKQQDIEKTVAEQQTKFEKISNEIKSRIFPIVNTIAEKALKITEEALKLTEGVTGAQVKAALQIGGVLAGGALVALLARGTSLNPMFVKQVGTGVGTGGGGGRSVGRGGGGFRGAYEGVRSVGRAARGGFRGGGLRGAFEGVRTNIGRQGGSKALFKGAGNLFKGAGKLFKGGAMGALFAIPELIDIIASGGGMAEIIPLLFSVLGGAGGALLGSLGGPLGTFAGGAAGGYGGKALGNALVSLFGGGAATGQVVSSPRLFMVGEENRTEAIIPTERIRKGLPIDAGVARELGSIGVPGYMTGLGTLTGRRSSRAKREQIRSSQATVQQGAQSDPAVIRERELAFERAAQKERDEQRRMMANIEQKSLEILEEEKRAASNISTSHGKFSRGVSLFERIQQAAGQYARKTFNRFADNLKKNNGDLRAALKDTWAQTVGDIENLQQRLLGKLEGMISNLVNKVGNYLADKAGDVVDYLADKGKSAINYLTRNNAANSKQVTEGVVEIFEDVKTTAVGGYEAALNSTDELALDTLTPLSQGDMIMSPDGMTMVEPPPDFYDKMINPVKNLTDTVSRSIGNAVRNSQEGFARGREFGRADSATRGNLETDGFFEGGGAKVGQALGELEKRLGPVGKGLSAFTRNLDSTSVGMLASGDFTGVAEYALKKEVTSRAIEFGTDKLAGAALGDLGIGGQDNPLLAGAANIAQGNYKAAAGDIGLDIGAMGIEKGVNALVGGGVAKSGVLKGLSVGGGVAAAGLGAVGGIMQGDYKMAAKGAAEGAVGYVIGGALTPVLGPLGPIVGGIVAGPVTDGIITTGKELGKGAKNLGKGVGKLFKGDFKGGLGSLGKGAGQILMSGVKGLGSLAKGLGGLVGIGRESKKDKRRKFIKMLMHDLATGRPLVGQGGRMKNKKAQERLLVGLKWGENGPDQALMNEMTAQIMTIAGVPMDIAQAFIFAAAGAKFNDEDLAQLDAEMGTGFKNADLSNQFDMSTKKGRKQAYRFIREDSGANISTNLSTVRDATRLQKHAETQRQSELIKQEMARLQEGGLTVEELRQVAQMAGGADLTKTFDNQNQLIEGGGSGINTRTGNVFLDGVMVGTISMESADELKADGLQPAIVRQVRDLDATTSIY